MKPVAVQHVYSQEADSCQSGDLGQTLTVETQDAGGGNYVVISTERWAIDADGIDAFARMLRDVLGAAKEPR